MREATEQPRSNAKTSFARPGREEASSLWLRDEVVELELEEGAVLGLDARKQVCSPMLHWLPVDLSKARRAQRHKLRCLDRAAAEVEDNIALPHALSTEVGHIHCTPWLCTPCAGRTRLLVSKL